MLDVKFKGSDKARALAMLSNAELDKDKQYHLTLKEVKPKRSLNANNYFWRLCDKIAERIHESPVEIYRGYIRGIGGVSEDLKINPNAVEMFRRYWGQLGLGWTVDIVDYDGDDVIIRAYKGSSQYDSTQMKRLIQLAEQDAASLNIETFEDLKVKQLIDEWGE